MIITIQSIFDGLPWYRLSAAGLPLCPSNEFGIRYVVLHKPNSLLSLQTSSLPSHGGHPVSRIFLTGRLRANGKFPITPEETPPRIDPNMIVSMIVVLQDTAESGLFDQAS